MKIYFLVLLLLLSFPHMATAKVLLTSWDQLTLVGGFSVPAVLIGSSSTRYASGSFDKRPGTNKWIAHHGTDGRIVEFTEPSAPNMSFPTLTVGRTGLPFTTVNDITAKGVQWVDADNVICSGRYFYSSGASYNWVSIWNLDTGTETLQTVGNVDETSDWAEGSTSNLLFHTIQSFGTGFTRIPADWANDNGLTGKTIGMTAGGYDVINSPMGPAAAAFAIGDTLPVTLIDYPLYLQSSDGNSHFEIRDKNYAFPVYGTTPPYTVGGDYTGLHTPIAVWRTAPDFGELQSDPQLWGSVNENVGYFSADEVSHGAGWIDDTSIKGLVYGIASPNGYLDYDAQGYTGAGDMFLVYDPVAFYDGGGAHYDHPTTFAGGPAGSFSNYLYVYDPDCLASVATTATVNGGDGTTEEWECAPTIITPDFSNLPVSPIDRAQLPTKIAGVFWDDDREYLWLVLTQMSSGNLYPMLVAYSLNSDGIPDQKRPWSFSGAQFKPVE